MDLDFVEMAIRIIAALTAGAFIGYERSYRGRPAGFRTHALVCMASSMLMLITVYEEHWVHTVGESVRLDPTRMAQGIMTGIGFLGAGVIVKEGLGARLTAASIWITAAIGLLGSAFTFRWRCPWFLRWRSVCVPMDQARGPAQAYYILKFTLRRRS